MRSVQTPAVHPGSLQIQAAATLSSGVNPPAGLLAFFPEGLEEALAVHVAEKISSCWSARLMIRLREKTEPRRDRRDTRRRDIGLAFCAA